GPADNRTVGGGSHTYQVWLSQGPIHRTVRIRRISIIGGRFSLFEGDSSADLRAMPVPSRFEREESHGLLPGPGGSGGPDHLRDDPAPPVNHGSPGGGGWSRPPPPG